MTQTLPLPRLQHLLLDLLSPCRPVQQAQLDQLLPSDWGRLMDLLRQHRLAPLLHWQLRQSHVQLVLPSDIQQHLASSYQQSTLRSLALQRELLLVHRVLEGAQIPQMALKGAYLAFHVYPHPALRPLRDLDILVPKHQALQAYQVLQDGGLKRIEDYQGTPEAALDLSKHLPRLRSPSGSVNVELHSRLFTPHEGKHTAPAVAAEPGHDLSEDPQFWQRSQTAGIAGAHMRFESPTDLLYHLIVHAAYDHEFSNGPLLLADLAFLLKTHPIDWPLFWALASHGSHSRGCALALKLLQRYWGPMAVEWCGHQSLAVEITESMLDDAALLMLRSFEAKDDVTFHANLDSKPTFLNKASFILGRFFVSRKELAAQYPVQENNWRVYGYYPARWWRLTTKRLPYYLRTKTINSLQNEARQVIVLRHWLRFDSPVDIKKHF